MIESKWIPRVYISGPITKGDRIENYSQACHAEKELMLKGFAPLNPMRSMVLPQAWDAELTHDLWLQSDLPWVECAEAVLRLPGESEGADRECKYAESKGIPVFISLGDLMLWKIGSEVEKGNAEVECENCCCCPANWEITFSGIINDTESGQNGIINETTPVAQLPTNAAERKATPIATGVLDYFPLALAEVARLSKVGNDQHNPGQPLHWDKTKSTDHADCIVRHLIDRGTFDNDGQRHSAKVAWRALALLQTELELAIGA